MPHHISIPLADGVRLHAESHGRPDAPVTVLLLHGWTLDGRTWHRQVGALAEALGEAVRIVTYDARGHGRSGTIPRHSATLAHLGDDLAQVLAHLAPAGPVLLGGHSMGGMTIMEYAHRHPTDFAARVGGLVFVATTAEGHTHTRYGLPTALGQLIRLMETTGAGVLARCGRWRPPRPVLHALRPSLRWLLFGDACDPADIRLAISAVARATMTSIGGFRASIGAQQRLATLATLGRLPVAALVGDRDRLTPPACAESIAGALPRRGPHADAGTGRGGERRARRGRPPDLRHRPARRDRPGPPAGEPRRPGRSDPGGGDHRPDGGRPARPGAPAAPPARPGHRPVPTPPGAGAPPAGA